MRNIFLIGLFLILNANTARSQFESPVKWEISVNQVKDGVYKIRFDAEIKEPWHMYAARLEREGPIPTTFIFEDNSAYKLVGELNEIVKPLIKFDEGFRFNVGMYYKKASFSQEVKTITGNNVVVNASVEYQCCNDEICLPPVTETFNIKLPDASTFSAGSYKTPESKENGDSIKNITQAAGFIDTVKVRDEKIITEVNDQAATGKDQSLLLFFLIAFLAGLAAILTPCVFPMIPMTVSFFMRGSNNRTNAVLKGIFYGLSIIFLYSLLGVLVSLTGMDANIGNLLSTHWIPNLIFFLLFLIFAASFLGLFEMVLPSGLINKADQQADKGGFGSVFFMGLTTVLVSFSCTGPIVGSLLIEATGDEVLKPILGMFFFSLAFALPFTLLAIFPSLLKNLPRSGGWLNSVKVVLGFIVLAFSLKFLSNIDQSYHLGIFSREVYLGIWFILSVMLGFYLLGKLRFANDSDLPYISVPRFILAVVSFTFALYLFTGILGADLQSISSMIPPKSKKNLSMNLPVNQSTMIAAEKNWCGPGKYDDLFELPNGLKGYFHYDDGIACARKLDKPIFLDFTGHSCSNCKQMESKVWPADEVLTKLRNDFVIISLYTDDKTKLELNEWITRPDGKVLKNIGEMNKYFQIDRFKTVATPWYILLDPDGNILVPPRGKDLDIKSFSSFLQSGIDKYRSMSKRE